MFLQALAEYADSHLAAQLGDVAFEQKRVSYLIELGAGGLFVGLTDCQSGSRGVPGRVPFLPVPRSPRHRTGCICPLLACDNQDYVLGAGEKHNAFVQLIEEAEADSPDAALQACLRFYGSKTQINSARKSLRLARPAAGAVIALSLGGPVILREKVRSFWRGHYARHFDTRLSRDRTAMCLVSGRIGPVLDTHEKIKSVSAIGGPPAGASLVSFGAKAFNSYGWRFGVNSPVSAERAAAYTLGLSSLLRGGSASRIDHSGTAFLYWTDPPCIHSPMALIERPNEAAIASLDLPDMGSDLGANSLHVIGISANSSRLIVRCSITENLDRVVRRLQAWFADLEIADPFTGRPAAAPCMAALLSGLARGGHAPAQTTVRLYRRALLGEPLGLAELSAALRRRRVAFGAAKLTPALAGLIRLSVNDCAVQQPDDRIPAQLDDSIAHPSYLCGRLLALCDVLEYQAGRRSGASVSDRYYALLSPGGGAVLPRLFELSATFRRRLTLRRPPQTSVIVGLIEALEERLYKAGTGSLWRLDLEDQGRLALGFHHQSAANTARAQLRDRERPDKKRRRQAAHA